MTGAWLKSHAPVLFCLVGEPWLRVAVIASGHVSTASFPYRSYRPGQKEAIDAAREAFEAGKRFVVVEAPTGSGKSGIAVTMARESDNAFVVTAQKLLQDQYVHDFPDLALMKGRANYPCLIAPTHAAAAPCLAGRKLPECEDCPYFTAKDAAIAASNTTMNYAYYLAELNYSGGFGERELLVLDEAHNAEAALMNFAQVTVSDQLLATAGVPAQLPPFAQDRQDWFDWAEELLPLLTKRSAELEERIREAPIGSELSLAMLRSRQWLDNSGRRLQDLLLSHDAGETDWVVEQTRRSEGQAVTFKPVRVAAFADEYLFRHGRRVLMLSATILDADTYLASLGIDPEDAAVIRVDSDFPLRNRPIKLRPSARLTRHHLERDLPRLAQAIARVMDEHPTEKGVIHAHSYQIAGFIRQNLPAVHRNRLVVHFDSSGREAALHQHMTSPDATVLLTPSMTEGIDLADDLARWQVLCKIPYPNLGDPQVKARSETDRSWYDWRTCLSVVQAYGRVVRGRDDYAVTYLLDADFPAFIRRQRQRLPDWFMDAVEPDGD